MTHIAHQNGAWVPQRRPSGRTAAARAAEAPTVRARRADWWVAASPVFRRDQKVTGRAARPEVVFPRDENLVTPIR
jgi:hypothetical protein